MTLTFNGETRFVKMLASLVDKQPVRDWLVRYGVRAVLVWLLAILHLGSSDCLNLFKSRDFMFATADAEVKTICVVFHDAYILSVF